MVSVLGVSLLVSEHTQLGRILIASVFSVTRIPKTNVKNPQALEYPEQLFWAVPPPSSRRISEEMININVHVRDFK